VETTPALGLALFGRRRCRWKTQVATVLRLLAGGYLVGLAALLAATLLPVLVGWRPYLITSGSMRPDVPAGSVVLADRDGTLSVAVGDVVVVDDPARPGHLLAHRVAEVRADGALVTKGDANPARDARPVSPGRVVGRMRAVVPVLGTIVRNPVAFGALALLAGFLLAAPGRRRARRLTRPLVATTAVAVLTSALTWQATAASSRVAPRPHPVHPLSRPVPVREATPTRR